MLRLAFMDRRGFEKLVQKAYLRIPERFRRRIANVAIVVEEEPSGEDLRSAKVPPGSDLLGLYHGLPLTERGWGRYSLFPDRISIYQRPLERAARSEAELEELVDDTLWHEVGHYFGLSEREIRRAELRRARERKARRRRRW